MAHKQDKEMVVRWARRKMASQDWVILDTETTGLGDQDEIVQIAIIGHDGRELLNSLVKPVRKSIPKEATAIHGIKIQHLDNAPTILELMPKIRKVIGKKTVICYNAAYDGRLLQQSIGKHKGNVHFKLQLECAMINFATYKGEPGKNGEYKWHKLEGGDHSALGDCMATHEVIKRIANDPIELTSYPWWWELRTVFVWLAIAALLYFGMLMGSTQK